MKYGASLRTHSIPAWAHHNVDYDEIKHFIKQHTTPGNGTTVSIPGTGDTRGQEVEDALFDILSQQHKRINMFVWSKTGEIRRRLDHLGKQTADLRSRADDSSNRRITARRLEQYGRLESDVLKAGEELRSLSRFITAQQTAFRKLIKKHKKWTNSTGLELTFNKEIMGDTESFTKIDLEPLLLEWQDTLDAVRVLYAERMSGTLASSPRIGAKPPQPNPGLQAALSRLNTMTKTSSRTSFDTLFATLPLGDGGRHAAYWVHPENIVELQVLLLQHTRSHAARHSSISGTPIGTLSRQSSQAAISSTRRSSTVSDQDTGLLIVDDQERFVRQQSSTTLEARENTAGVISQNAAVAARWTREDEAIIAAQSGKDIKETAVKVKYLAAVLNPGSKVPASKVSVSEDSANAIDELRSYLASNDKYRPLVTISSSRQRFTDIAADSSGFLLATLDKTISMKQTSLDDLGSVGAFSPNDRAAAFPYAVLRVRQEGSHISNLLRVLDNSHLVERVRGFSLEYHAVWHCCQPENTVAPFWVPLLEKDIRKLPKSVGWGRRDNSAISSNLGSQMTSPEMSVANTSESGHGDTTAVEESTLVHTRHTDPFGKKRARSYAQPQPHKQKYWSEYDHPSDDDDDDAYVLFIDPNAESALSQTWRSFRGMFKNRRNAENQPLLQQDDTTSSSDEEAQIPKHRNANNTRHSYGSMDGANGMMYVEAKNRLWLPQVTVTCLGASLAILVVGYLLAITGRKKQAREVDAGIIFAVASSLLFAISGVVSIFGGSTQTTWAARVVAMAVLGVDAVACSALLAWILA